MVLSIAIIGAGPSGCLLARLLQQSIQDIKVTIFESEGSPNFRSQGGTLDLHENTGLLAMRRAGLWDEFLKHARYDGEAFRIGDKNLLYYIKMGAAANAASKESLSGRPEIDRPRLREILYQSLTEGTVQWGKKLVRIDDGDAGSRTLHFADGTTFSDFDLLIGADGAWSKVRPLLSSAIPTYSGIGGHSLSIPDAERRHPNLHALANRGSMFAFSDGKSAMAQQMGDGSLSVSTWGRRPADWQQQPGYDAHDPAAVRKQYLEHEYSGWHPDLRALIAAATDGAEPVTPRNLYMLPVGHSWTHRAGLTLIGDAAHLMTPFAGEGVNLALEDALKLADAIISARAAAEGGGAAAGTGTIPKDQLSAAVAGFEREMFSRATKTQQLTVEMMNAMYYTPGAPRSVIAPYVLTAIRGPERSWMTLPLVPLVYAWFFVFKLFY